ncbi:uncharacterized protein METZ01_LOCUS30230, partial [marine metagenome]
VQLSDCQRARCDVNTGCYGPKFSETLCQDSTTAADFQYPKAGYGSVIVDVF